MPIVTTTTLTPPVKQSFAMKLLSIKSPNNIYKTAAVSKKAPANGGTEVVMRRFDRLPTALVPLGNTGVTPPSTPVTKVDITAQMGFYGQYIEVNEQVALQSQCPVLNSFAKLLGISLRQTEDELTRNMLSATAGVINCEGGALADNPTEISAADVSAVSRALMSADAYMIADSIEATDKFGTAPIRNAYFGFTHTNMTTSIEGCAGFVAKNEYSDQRSALRSEWGSVGNVRFLVTSNGAYTAGASHLGRDVYDTIICGMEAYAAIEQDKYSTEFIYHSPRESGPLELNSTIGYKFAEVTRILNDEWVLNLKSILA